MKLFEKTGLPVYEASFTALDSYHRVEARAHQLRLG